MKNYELKSLVSSAKLFRMNLKASVGLIFEPIFVFD